MVHPRHHAVFLCRARDLRRKLQHVRARRRVPRGQRGHGRHAGKIQRLRPDVRLHPDGPDQRRVRGPVHRRPHQRNLRLPPHRVAHLAGYRRGVLRDHVHGLFLVVQHQGRTRIQPEGHAHHADHDGDGRDPDQLVPVHRFHPPSGIAADPFSSKHQAGSQRHGLALWHEIRPHGRHDCDFRRAWGIRCWR